MEKKIGKGVPSELIEQTEGGLKGILRQKVGTVREMPIYSAARVRVDAGLGVVRNLGTFWYADRHPGYLLAAGKDIKTLVFGTRSYSDPQAEVIFDSQRRDP